MHALIYIKFGIAFMGTKSQPVGILVQGWSDRSWKTILVPRKLHAWQGFQVIKPNGILAKLGKERTADPIFIPALQKAKDECLVAHNLFDSSDLDLSGGATHGRSTGRTDQSGTVADSVAVKLLGLDERNFKVLLGTGITSHKHVVRNNTHVNFLAPLFSPNLGIIVDSAHNGALRPNGSKGFLLDAIDGILDLFRSELTGVSNVSHNGNVATTFFACSSKQVNQFISIGISSKTLRPKGETAGSDTKILDVGQKVGVA
jgi:hypothetical protein